MPQGALCLYGDRPVVHQRLGISAVIGEDTGVTKSSWRRSTKESRGNGEVVFQGHRLKFILGFQAREAAGLMMNSSCTHLASKVQSLGGACPCLCVDDPLIADRSLIHPNCFGLPPQRKGPSKERCVFSTLDIISLL